MTFPTIFVLTPSEFLFCRLVSLTHLSLLVKTNPGKQKNPSSKFIDGLGFPKIFNAFVYWKIPPRRPICMTPKTVEFASTFVFLTGSLQNQDIPVKIRDYE